MIIAWLLACNPESVVLLEDRQNYAIDTWIDAGTDTVRSGYDSTVDWSGLDVDLLGYPVDPAVDITTIGLVQFQDLSQDEVLTGINDDTLQQAQLTAFADYTIAGGETNATLSQFSLLGTYVDPAVNITEDGGTYLVSAVTGESTYRMLGFFSPVVDAGIAPITLTGDSATIGYDVTLDSGFPVTIPRSNRVSVDWSGITTNGSGLPINLPDIDRLMLAHYTGSVADLQADFLHIQTLPDHQWTADVGGWGDWPLADLEDSDGQRFDGFDQDGTWLLAMICSTCLNPAPPFLALVQPE